MKEARFEEILIYIIKTSNMIPDSDSINSLEELNIKFNEIKFELLYDYKWEFDKIQILADAKDILLDIYLEEKKSEFILDLIFLGNYKYCEYVVVTGNLDSISYDGSFRLAPLFYENYASSDEEDRIYRELNLFQTLVHMRLENLLYPEYTYGRFLDENEYVKFGEKCPFFYFEEVISTKNYINWLIHTEIYSLDEEDANESITRSERILRLGLKNYPENEYVLLSEIILLTVKNNLNNFPTLLDKINHLVLSHSEFIFGYLERIKLNLLVNNYIQVKNDYETLIKLNPSGKTYYNFADFLFKKLREYKYALVILNKNKNYNFYDSIGLEGEIYEALNEYEKALNSYVTAIFTNHGIDHYYSDKRVKLIDKMKDLGIFKDKYNFEYNKLLETLF